MKNRRVAWLVIVLLGMIVAFVTLFPFQLFAPINFFANPEPTVVPVLREWHGGSGSVFLNASSNIVVDSAYASQLLATAQLFQQDIRSETNLTLATAVSSDPGSGNFFLTLSTRDSGLGNEGYTFTIDTSVVINARTVNGVFYGTRTVLQILHNDATHTQLPKGYARDYPSYQERGFMLDVGRKFIPLPLLEDYVRLMSWYKFNDFQLHFNDNEIGGGDSPDWQHKYAAFRLNSPAFPGLAAKDGSYTQQQIQELEQVAQTHAVVITPEIDTPAHALALTQYRPDLASKKYSKEFLDLDNPASQKFVNSLWSEFLPWFTTSQVHMGMDEYDARDSDQYRTFINNTDTFLNQKGKTVRMWGSLSLMPSKIKVQSNIVIEDWNNQWANPVDMDRQGFSIINANDALLYIVPHANYYHDFLDTQLLYTSWDPSVFSLTNPALNLQPDDPHLLGGMFALWNDKLGKVTSNDDVTQRIEPALPVLGEKMWSGTVTDINYTQFELIVREVGTAPGTSLS